jgi:hypothetical protein
MRETGANEPLMKNKLDGIKTRELLCPGKSMAETYLLAMRCPVYRRRESHLGFRTELENLAGDGKGKKHKRKNREADRLAAAFFVVSQVAGDAPGDAPRPVFIRLAVAELNEVLGLRTASIGWAGRR